MTRHGWSLGWRSPRHARASGARPCLGSKYRAWLAPAIIGLTLCATAASAHHVGVYVPRDNEISANFKQLKFAIQAGKFDVASRLFENGALRAEMRTQQARLPAGIEDDTRAALRAGDGRRAERALMVLFASLIRDLALTAERKLADASEPNEARLAAARKLLEAMWRYYNLVDFAVTQADTKAGVAIRLAFDEAEGYVRDPRVNASAQSKTGVERSAPAPEPTKMREPLRRIAQLLSGLIETTSTSTRRTS